MQDPPGDRKDGADANKWPADGIGKKRPEAFRIGISSGLLRFVRHGFLRPCPGQIITVVLRRGFLKSVLFPAFFSGFPGREAGAESEDRIG